jgi:protein SCO1/2
MSEQKKHAPGYRLPILVGLLLLIIAIAWWASDRYRAPVVQLDMPGVRVMERPLQLQPFSLLDHREAPFDNARLNNRWTVMFFGYTHCPDVCPTTLTVMNQVHGLLADQQPGKYPVQFVFVSVDPFRDTAGVLADHMAYFNPEFTGVTGPAEEILQLATQVGAFYDYEDPVSGELVRDVTRRPAAEDYIVNHYASLFLLTPRGRLVTDILPPHDPQRVVEIINNIQIQVEN